MYVRIADLRIGETFIEDTYPEVWRVVSYGNQEGYPTITARVVENLGGVPSPREGEITEWFGEGFCLIRLS